MELSNEKRNQLIKKLLFSRTRVLTNYGFLGLLLMHLKIVLDPSIETAATDAKYIYFNPEFLDLLSENELDFILMHEILHVVLKHCFRYNDRDDYLFNIACDIVVNSIILSEHKFDLNAITLKEYGTSMHLTPDGKEGCEFTAEEVYEMVIIENQKKIQKGKGQQSSNCGGDNVSEGVDDHSKWKNNDHDSKIEQAEWDNRIYEAAKAVERQESIKQTGSIPNYIQRIIKQLTTPQIDWRYILNEFIQEEINDYTFLPPDYRYDNGFFLPSYSDTEEVVKDILFMIDTSGSMTDEMITMAYSEIYGAVQMFNGKFKGYLGFFDAAVYEPIEFNSISDLKKIIPYGGGGTNFHIIFDYIKKMKDKPALVIILTDGYADFPDESYTDGIPVLWLLTTDVVPPFGKIARLEKY